MKTENYAIKAMEALIRYGKMPISNTEGVADIAWKIAKRMKENEQPFKNCFIDDVVGSLPDEGISITTEGHMNGNWQMKISQIKDEDLERTEIGVLKLFGREKNKLRQ